MALKFPLHFPIFFDPNLSPNPNPRSSSELRFSRWNTAKSHREAPSRSTSPVRRGKNSKTPPNRNPNVDTESHPAFRFSNIPKSKPRPVSTAPENVKISDDGMSYVIDGAPFEFKYSYTETPKVKPVKIREAPFVPFGPATMPRPWTGRAPLPPSKKKLKEFDSFVLPPPHKKGVKPVQSPGPFLPGTSPRYVQSREEILGEPLTKEEISDLIRGCIKTSRQLNIGRDGLTHNMLDNIHAHWKRRRVCKIRCKGVCTVDMDNVCQQLEEKTGGKIIYRRGGILYLFRGRNYNYKTRPRFPLMLWKPVPPVYPRLVNRVPEGLTLEEATEMRQKGRMLIPICKLGKNGVYCNLVRNVREAFEECDLVRINCQGLNKSDYRKIGAKLRDLVPCTLLSFENEHILMWRGRDWKSSLPDLGGGSKEDKESDVDNENHETLPSEAIKDSALCLKRNSVEHISNLSLETSVSSNSSDVTLDEDEVLYPTESNKQHVSVVTDAPYPTEDNKQSVSEVTNVTSVAKFDEAETMNDASGSCDEPEPCSSTSPSTITSQSDSHAECPSKAMIDSLGTEDVMDSESCSDGLHASISGSDAMIGGSDNHINGMVDPHADKLLDGSRVADASPPSSPAAPCMEKILLLLEQAVDKGSALALDKDYLDADNIYQTTVTFAKSAPPEPVFRRHKKVVVQNSDKREGTTSMSDKQEGMASISDKQEGSVVVAKESRTVSMKGKREKSSKIPKRGNFDERFSNVVPQGTLGVDELAKLLT